MQPDAFGRFLQRHMLGTPHREGAPPKGKRSSSSNHKHPEYPYKVSNQLTPSTTDSDRNFVSPNPGFHWDGFSPPGVWQDTSIDIYTRSLQQRQSRNSDEFARNERWNWMASSESSREGRRSEAYNPARHSTQIQTPVPLACEANVMTRLLASTAAAILQKA